jgi:hypothetical protein
MLHFALHFLLETSSPLTCIQILQNQVRLKLNGTHQLLVCADDVNLFGDKCRKEKQRTLIDANKEVRMKVNAEKTKRMLFLLSPECRAKS